MTTPVLPSPEERRSLAPGQARELFRAGLRAQTSGWCTGWTQANLIAVPEELAYDVLLFAQRNPQPCPVLDVGEPGGFSTSIFEGDLRTDLPAYVVYEHGEPVAEVTDAREHWRPDLVPFLIGCSFTFETALLEAGVPVRHVEAGTNVPMYRTSTDTAPGRFPARPARGLDAPRSRRPGGHRRPGDLALPGRPRCARARRRPGRDRHHRPRQAGLRGAGRGGVPTRSPVFWACGVTPQAAVMASRPDFAIGHAPGHMAITDVRDSRYVVP